MSIKAENKISLKIEPSKNNMIKSPSKYNDIISTNSGAAEDLRLSRSSAGHFIRARSFFKAADKVYTSLDVVS